MFEHIKAKKSLGQNFLINDGIVQKIIVAAELTGDDVVLEVGPGTGILTRALVQTGARVIAVEKDRNLIEDLEAEFSAAQVEIIEKDILDFDPAQCSLVTGQYKVVANLPYYITSHFIRTVFEKWPRTISMVIMVQKEVARRMMAKPPDLNLLALSVQYYATVQIVSHVSKGSFRPEPTVDSTVVKLVPIDKDNTDATEFFKIVHAGFASKRKTLQNNLSTIFPKEAIIKALESSSLDPNIRAENLSLAQWEALCALLRSAA